MPQSAGAPEVLVSVGSRARFISEWVPSVMGAEN